MKKRLLCALLALIMVFALLPAAAEAETVNDYTMDFTATTAQGWAGGQDPATEDCTATKWEWLYATKTLYLKGLDFRTTADIAIKLPAGATVVVENSTTNTVESRYSGSSSTYGIYCGGTLSFEGAGALTVTGGTSSSGDSYGIQAVNVNVSECTLNAMSTATSGNSYGIYATNALNVTDGALTCTGGATSAATSVGAYVSKMTVSGGTVTATGGSSTNTSGTSSGIIATSSVTVSGGTVTATGGAASDAKGTSCGILVIVDGSMTFTGGAVTAKSGTAFTKNALSKAPAFSNTAQTNAKWYQWRTADSGAYTLSCITAYTHAASHTFFEIKCYDYTMDFTSDTAQAWAGNKTPKTEDCSGTGWDWKYATKTLTLSGLDFATTALIAVGLPEDSNIVLQDGTVSSVRSDLSSNYPECCGIKALSGTVTISGGGTLNTTAFAHPASNASCSYGFYADKIVVTSGILNASGDNEADIVRSIKGYGIYADSLTVSGGTVNAAAGQASTLPCNVSQGVSANSLTVSGGTLTGVGGGTSTSNGAYATSITLTGGTVILKTTSLYAATDNSVSALNVQPVFSNTAQPNAKWYQWRTADSGAYTPSTTNEYVFADTEAYVELIPFTSATVGSVTVSGTVGTALTDTDVTVSLTYDSFNAIAADTDVSSWFTGLPVGLIAKLKSDVAAGAATAILTVSGTPTAQSSAAISIVLPAGALAGGASLTTLANAGAKFDIVTPPAPPVTPSSGGSSYFRIVTVYNDCQTPGKAIWLTGQGLMEYDELITGRLSSGKVYKRLKALSGGANIWGIYDISLKSKQLGYSRSPLTLHFNLENEYAFREFTLIHIKADGTTEYLYAAADLVGDLHFYPIYDFSPYFMLVEGTVKP